MFFALVFVFLAAGSASEAMYQAPAPDWAQTMQRDLRGG
jgi:cbb3-type cytochrome oxidase subunit 1